MTTMTPAETLDRHAREADRLAHDWPAWRDRPIPDGQPRAARTDGMPRSNDVSDPVLSTVIARDGMLVKDGVNLEAQVSLLSGHLLELTLAMACNAIGHMPANRPDLTAGLRMAMSALALTTTSQNVRAWTGCDYDDTTWTQGEAMELVGVYLTRLRVIIPATQAEPLAPADVPRCKVVPDCNRLAVRAMADGTLGCWTHYKHERGEMAS